MTIAVGLILATLVAATVSGAIGMGGGSILLAVMASALAADSIVPLHGLVQMTSNGFRSLLLLKNVCWWAFAYYVPTQLLGVWFAREIYRGVPLEWLKPIIGIFLLASIAWKRLKPKRLILPRWSFAVGGFGGGVLGIFVGVTGPYLAAFFLRDDMEKEEIVATKASIQLVGHALKIPVFLSLGFAYGEHLGLVLPLLVAAVAGTWLGTRVLKRMRNDTFRLAFEGILGLLALRLVADPWL